MIVIHDRKGLCTLLTLELSSLHGADLRNANLENANLVQYDLQGADLRGANLVGADLRLANLSGADLRGADLTAAELMGANLDGVKADGPLFPVIWTWTCLFLDSTGSFSSISRNHRYGDLFEIFFVIKNILRYTHRKLMKHLV